MQRAELSGADVLSNIFEQMHTTATFGEVGLYLSVPLIHVLLVEPIGECGPLFRLQFRNGFLERIEGHT